MRLLGPPPHSNGLVFLPLALSEFSHPTGRFLGEYLFSGTALQVPAARAYQKQDTNWSAYFD
jgi:hypothetical protein